VGLALLFAVGLVLTAIEALLRGVTGGSIGAWLHVTAALVAFDVGVTLALVIAAKAQLRRRAISAGAGGPSPALSVLVAAYDEADVIASTVGALAAQTDVAIEILVGDDGSTDGTLDALRATYDLTPVADEWVGALVLSDGRSVPLRVVPRPHAGKGATLNALAARAKHPVLVTVDADTVPTHGALAAMARAFADPQVDSAAGMVTVRNGRDGWLLHHQSAEYQKNSVVRIGWSALGGLEQVPGAFTGVRASAFHAAGGFPEDSLTEDYELTYRLVRQGVAVGRAPVVVTVPEAQVLTLGPSTLAGFIRQRTRWFAGFLTTLARFPDLVLQPRAAAFGLVRFPLKVLDAVLPLLWIVTIASVLRNGPMALVPSSRAALALFAVRWGWDVVLYRASDRVAATLGEPRATRAVHPARFVGWACAATEALSYAWLKQLATLRAYGWALRRLRTWEHSRQRARTLPERSSLSP
jgi:cellulose synthase/poly-beta-1,6-N-acetylglucosamine synthase-like glycosyltransferase